MKNTKLYPLIIAGHLLINFPVLIIWLSPPVLVYLFVGNIYLKIIFIVFTFIAGIGFAWLWWSYFITKWRIWAFNQLEEEDWPKLKKLAIHQKLIWPDDIPFDQTEFRNADEQRIITNINEKTSHLNQIEDIKQELSTPNEVSFKFNKLDIIIESFAMIFILLIVILACFLSFKMAILGLIMLLFVIRDLDKLIYLKYILRSQYGLIISDQQITIFTPFKRIIPWNRMLDLFLADEDKKIIIDYYDNKGERKLIKVELRKFKIGDANVFSNTLSIFVDRFYKIRKKQFYS